MLSSVSSGNYFKFYLIWILACARMTVKGAAAGELRSKPTMRVSPSPLTGEGLGRGWVFGIFCPLAPRRWRQGRCEAAGTWRTCPLRVQRNQ